MEYGSCQLDENSSTIDAIRTGNGRKIFGKAVIIQNFFQRIFTEDVAKKATSKLHYDFVLRI